MASSIDRGREGPDIVLDVAVDFFDLEFGFGGLVVVAVGVACGLGLTAVEVLVRGWLGHGC